MSGPGQCKDVISVSLPCYLHQPEIQNNHRSRLPIKGQYIGNILVRKNRSERLLNMPDGLNMNFANLLRK